MNIKAAAYSVMAEAYRIASGDDELPANARQIMYAARGKILKLTGRDKFGDDYFTQTLLPNYVLEHSEETASWNVVFDGRGSFQGTAYWTRGSSWNARGSAILGRQTVFRSSRRSSV